MRARIGRNLLAGLIVFICAALLVTGMLANDASAIDNPASTNTPTVTPAPGTGSVTGMAWNDLDGNGVRATEEGGLPGVSVHVTSTDGQSTDVSAITGANGAYVIAGLLPGTYRITAIPPSGYQSTSQSTHVARLADGDVLVLDFGAQFVPTPTATNTPLPVLDASNAEQAYCGGLYAGQTGAGRSDVRVYGCRPSWDESGPEIVYRIELDASQQITASFVNASADLDLFLLRYVYPDSCLVAGDTFLRYQGEPGVYLLAVDGYRGASGSYQVRVDCPLGVQATATPTFTPSPTPTPGPTSTRAAGPRIFLPRILMGNQPGGREY